MQRLVCPTCQGELRCESFAEEPVAPPPESANGPADDSHVQEGLLICEPCQAWYPVHRYVPVMLDFSTNFHQHFSRQHAAHADVFNKYHAPQGEPREGERSIQETFTDEWNQVNVDEIHFDKSHEQFVELIRAAWLKWIERDHVEVKQVLDVGCGLGREAMALATATGAEVTAIDLNFAVLRSGPQFRHIPNVHLVIASLFQPPFRTETFDLVFSQGVIHHTYSSEAAFRSIARFVRPGGHCFIWVYAFEDSLTKPGLSGFLLRRTYDLESLLRPAISRSPKPLRDVIFVGLTAAAYPFWKARARMTQRPQSWNSITHHMRDVFSPRYAYRHGYNELIGWFESEKFRIVDVQSDVAHRQIMNGTRAFGVGLTGRKLGHDE